jgi:hypothetical protein
MFIAPDERFLEPLLDKRVDLLIQINLIENGKPDPYQILALLKRKLRALELEIDEVRHEPASGWRGRALRSEKSR